MTSPCKDCTERKLRCHSTCPKYQAYHKQQEAARKKARGISEIESYKNLASIRLHRNRGDFRKPK